MAYNQLLAKRIEASFSYFPKEMSNEITQKKMFGGIVFLYKGKMSVGVMNNDLMVRVLSHEMEISMQRDYVRPMDFSKKPVKEFIYVSAEGFKTEEELQHWIELGVAHAQHKLK
ncbi:TfoX/Sxy family protein [Cellulophaga baltica]|uniref:TfoX/Sxy family protein n=1 Tax=Cellulophaga TaxID=104264 RepID=UPI001C07D72D|nr:MULTISPECIES: TfoX/Sxy family protein [Cellulophaga]MBU2996711.1 TfoX/Sxy family protein [Cellulophaga baltica]MDO6768105.1 TfoX/Sxy family protein [Cellulophaga sp. 1_MG-2023]